MPLTREYVLARLRYHPRRGQFTHRLRPVITAKDQTWNTRYAGKRAGWLRTENDRQYRMITLDDKRWYAHHIVWLLETGTWPTNTIDHRNGNASDNRFCNLRACTQSQNCMNARIAKNNTSGVRGVHYATHYECYIAKIEKDGKVYHIGYFDTVKEAAKARAKAEERMYGDFHHRKYRKVS